MFTSQLEIITKIRTLDETKLRKLIRAFFAEKISDRNVQPYHGPGEHGVDTLATISKLNDRLNNEEILYIQVKSGDITLNDWRNQIQGQMMEAYNSTVMPIGTSKDNPRRLLLIVGGEFQPEVFEAISNWNRNSRIPIEVFDIWGILNLFEKYNLGVSDFDDLFKIAEKLGF